MSWTTRSILVGCLLFTTACATNKHVTTDDAPGAAEGEAMKEASKTVMQENEVSSEVVEQNIERPYKSAYGDIDLDQNEHVQKWINYFQGRGRSYMETYLSRSTRYLPMMKNVLRENGLPEELVYIALIESGFSPRAHS